MHNKEPRDFGENLYFLPLVKDANDQEIRNSLLSETKRLRLLRQPPLTDVKYAVAALLYQTDLEFQTIKRRFNKFRHRILSKVKTENSRQVNLKKIFDVKAYLVKLDFPKKASPYWVNLFHKDYIVAQVLIKPDETIIFTEQSIILAHIDQLISLKIYSSNLVYLNNNIQVENELFIFADQVATASGIKIRAKNLFFSTLHSCYCDTDTKVEFIQIKSPMFTQKGLIETQEAQIITHQADQEGDIFAKKCLTKIAYEWHTKISDQTFATVHSPGSVQILCAYYKHAGSISANSNILHTFEAQVDGEIYSGETASIHSQNCLMNTKTSQFYFKGKVFLTSEFYSSFAGNIFYSPTLDISWKKITQSKEAAISARLDKGSNIIKIHANNHVNISGNIIVKDAAIEISAGQKINLSGLVWHQANILDAFNVSVTTKELNLTGDLRSNVNTNFLVSSFHQKGKVIASTINMRTVDYHLHTGATTRADQLYIQASGAISAEKLSHLLIKSAWLECKDLYLRGEVEINKALFEVRRLTLILGKKRIKDLACVTPLFFSIGHLDVAERLSITSYISFTAGLITAGQMNTSSLLNINLFSFLVQHSIQVPSLLTKSLAAFNLILGLANLAYPALQATTIPIQIMINSALQVYSTHRLVQQTRLSIMQQMNSNHPNNFIRTLAIFSQLMTSFVSLLLPIRKNILGIMKINIPSNISFQTPTFSALSKTLATSAAKLISGNNNFSLIDIGFGRFYSGISSSDSHLFSASFGASTSFFRSDIDLFSATSDFNISLGLSNSLCYQRFEIGNTITPIDYSINTKDLYVFPVAAYLPLPSYLQRVVTYNNWTIQAEEAHTFGNTTIIYSTMSADILYNNGKFQGAGSTIVIGNIVNSDKFFVNGSFVKASIDNRGAAIFVNDQLELDKVNNNSEHQVQIVMSKGRINSFVNSDKSLLAIDASELDLSQCVVSKESKVGVRSSKVTIEHLENNSDIDIFNSDCTFDEMTASGDDNKLTLTDSWVLAKKSSGNVIKRDSVFTDHEDASAHDTFIGKQLKFTPSFDGKIIYDTTGPLNFRDQNFYSLLPLCYGTSEDIGVEGKLTSYSSLILKSGGRIDTYEAQLSLGDSSIFQSKNGSTYYKSTINCLGKFQGETEGKFINKGSIFNADEGVVIIGKKGIESDSLVKVTTKTDREWRWRGFHSGWVTTTDTTSTITPPIYSSSDGKVYMYSAEGDITSNGILFDANKILLVAPEGNVTDFEVQAPNYHSEKSYTIFGVDKETIKTVTYMPGTWGGKDNITIISKGKFIGHGTVFKSDHKVQIKSSFAEFSRPILTTTYQYEHTGFSIGPGSDSVFTGHVNPAAYIPIYQAYLNLRDARSQLGKFAGTLNFGIATTNQTNTAFNDWMMDSPTPRIAGDFLFSKNILDKLFGFKINIGTQKTTITSQSLGSGGVEAEELDVDAKTIIFDNDYELNDTKCILNATSVEFNGATLKNSMQFEQIGANIQMSAWTMNISDVGIEMQQSSFDQTTHEINKNHIPNLVINADELTLNSTQLEADKVTGRVDKVIINSEKNTESSKNSSMQVGTSGEVSFNHRETYDESIPEESSFTSSDFSEFHIGEIETTNANTNLVADNYAENSLSLEHSRDGFGFNFNLNLNSLSSTSSSPTNSVVTNDLLGTINFNFLRKGEEINFQIPYLNQDAYQQLQQNIKQLNQPIQASVPLSERSFTEENEIIQPMVKQPQNVDDLSDTLSDDESIENDVSQNDVNSEIDLSATIDTSLPEISNSVTLPYVADEQLEQLYDYSNPRSSLLIEQENSSVATTEYIQFIPAEQMGSNGYIKKFSIWDALDPIGTAYADSLDNDFKNVSYSLNTDIPPVTDDSNSSTRAGFLFKQSPNDVTEIEPLYRGDNTHFEQTFNNGFNARGTDTDLLRHAITKEYYYLDSAYISASLSKDVALKFPTPVPPGCERSYIYEIHPDPSRPPIDVADQLTSSFKQGLVSREDFGVFLLEQERAFLSKIEASEIKGAWEVQIRKIKVMDQSEIDWLDHPPSRQYIEEMCYEHLRIQSEEFIPNPNYVPPLYPEQRLWNYGRGLGHVFMGVGLALDGKSLYDEYQFSQITGNYNNTYREGTRIAGGWTGAYTTGTLFAELGMMTCAPLTPVGSAACGIVAGFIGSGIGYYGGSKFATYIYDVNNNRKNSTASSQSIWDALNPNGNAYADSLDSNFKNVNFSINNDSVNYNNFDWSTLSPEPALKNFKYEVDKTYFSPRGLRYYTYANHGLGILTFTHDVYSLSTSDNKLETFGEISYATAGSTFGGAVASNLAQLSVNGLSNLNAGQFRSPYISIPLVIGGSMAGSYGFTSLYNDSDRSEIGANLLANNAMNSYPQVTGRFGMMSKSLLYLGLGFSIYDIYQANNHTKELAHQSVLFSGGMLGTYSAGNIAAMRFACNVRPVCVAIGAALGAGVAVNLANKGWHEGEKLWNDYSNRAKQYSPESPRFFKQPSAKIAPYYTDGARRHSAARNYRIH